MRGVQFLFLLFGAALATIAPFVTVMLQARGLSPGEIGLVGSASALGFTLAVPVWGHLADTKLGRVRALQLAAVGAGFSLVLFDLPLPAFVLGAMVVGFNVFQSALGPLADALAVGVVADRPHEYGRIRLMSSLAYGVVVIGIGVLYDNTGYGPVPFIWLAASLLLVAGLFAVREPPRRSVGAMHRRGGSTRLALQVQPKLPVVLFVFGVLFFAVLGAFTFLNLRLVALGGTPSDIALAGGLSALTEVPGMILAGRLARRIGLRGLFVASGVIYSACILSWAVIDQPELIIATRAASGPAFAGLWVACVLTMNVLLPQGLQATGQGLYQTTAFGISAMIANAVGGIVYEDLGSPTLFAGAAVVAAVAAILGWVLLPRGRDLRSAPDLGERPRPEPAIASEPAPTAAVP